MTVLRNCCCFNLRTGAIILGWIGLAMSVIAFGKTFCIRDDMEYLRQYFADNNIDEASYKAVVDAVVTTSFCSATIQILMNISLIAGALKNNKLLLVPYLITNGIGIIFLVLVLFFFITVLFSTPDPQFHSMITVAFTVLFIYFSFVFYFWLSVFSFYRHIRLQEEIQHQRLLEDGSTLDAQQLAFQDSPPSYYTTVKK